MTNDDDANEPVKPEETAADDPRLLAQERAKQLARVVCICKGIPLAKVLPALEGSETVQDVNRKAGTGSGGCRGERCGPRIKILLRKFSKQP